MVKRNCPAVDLETIHDTLGYMHDDLARIPQLESAAQAIASAMNDIHSLQQQVLQAPNANAGNPSTALNTPTTAHFIPFSRTIG